MSFDTETSQTTDQYDQETPHIANPRLVRLSPYSFHNTPCSHSPSQLTQQHHLQIHEAQSPLWWLGRYTALSDRFRTGALPSPSGPQSPATDSSPISEPSSSGASSATSSSNDAKHPMHDAERRNRRVYIHLRSLCTTDEARASLDEFRGVMEGREQRLGGGVRGKVVREKQGWLEGLMGKGRRGEK